MPQRRRDRRCELIDDAVYEIVRLRSSLKRQEDREGRILHALAGLPHVGAVAL